jgi:hypothetical protein
VPTPQETVTLSFAPEACLVLGNSPANA